MPKKAAPDLLSYASKLAAKWPSPKTDEDGEADVLGGPKVLLSRETLPPPPEHMRTDRLVAALGTYNYSQAMPQPRITIFGDEAAIRALGLLIFAKLFYSDVPHVQVDLGVPNADFSELLESNLKGFGGPKVSVLRHLVIVCYDGSPAEPSSPNELVWEPTAFLYAPRYEEEHPLSGLVGVHREDLPCAYVDWLEDRGYRDEPDTLVGFGRASGSCRFAECLLNAAHVQRGSKSEREGVVFRFEGDVGNTSVDIGSAEIIVALPGSFYWLFPDLPDLSSVCEYPSSNRRIRAESL